MEPKRLDLEGKQPAEYIHPDDLERVQESFETLLEEPGRTDITEFRIETADGEWRWMENRAQNFLDDPDVNGILVSSRDITDRKERERRIRELNERLELAVEGAELGVWDWDMRTDEMEFNEQWAAMLGYSLEEIDGHLDAWEQRVHPDDMDHVEAALDAHIQGETDYYDTVHRLRTADGDWKWIRAVGRIFERDDDAEPVRAVGIHIDVDERKQRERTLEEQRDNLEVLNQVVRHDIRNELQIILAYTETMEPYLETDGQEYVDNVLQAARDAVDITRTARDVTQVMLKSDVDRRPIPLRSTLENEIDDVRSNYEHALIRVGAIPPVSVQADEMLESVFRNLLGNAIQHNDKEVPEVNVSATRAEGTVHVRIADNGPGIPEERKEQIFERGEIGLESDGAGLGLYLVDTLVGRYDGAVRVRDNEPEGTVFVVELPIAEG